MWRDLYITRDAQGQLATRGEDVLALQQATNRQIKRMGLHDLGVSTVAEDQVLGFGALQGARRVAHELGVADLQLTGPLRPHLQQAVRAPWRRTLAEIARGHRRMLARQRARRQHQAARDGTTVYDGHPVANWIIPILNYARAHGWAGQVLSGWRSDAYQAQLYAIYVACGFCPEHIAAPSGQSRHRYHDPYRGAVDVTERDQFQQIVAGWSGPGHLYPFGAGDPNHFSDTGH